MIIKCSKEKKRDKINEPDKLNIISEYETIHNISGKSGKENKDEEIEREQKDENKDKKFKRRRLDELLEE